MLLSADQEAIRDAVRAFAQAEKVAGNRRVSADGSLMKLKK